MTDTAKPLAPVTGVGPGTGAPIARRFAEGGYRVAILARDADRLASLQKKIPNPIAAPYDVAGADALERVIAKVGSPKIVIHNAVGGAFGAVMQGEAETLTRNFAIDAMALFHLARSTALAMVSAGAGALIVTGNALAQRGRAAFAGFAPTKAVQRILAESLARDLGPRGVCVAYLIVDAAIDAPWRRRRLPDAPDDFFTSPKSIAAEAYRLAHQARDAWSFLAEIRPFNETR